MPFSTNTFLGALFMCVVGLPVAAATATVESYEFDATLVAGTLVCGPNLAQLASCPEEFGKVSGTKSNDLMFGKTIGETYSGKIEVEYFDGWATGASCELGGSDCAFSIENLVFSDSSPKRLNFSKGGGVLSSFRLDGETGKYFFGTDIEFLESGAARYYAGVEFDLTNVVKASDVAVVPLMGSAGFMVLALGGFAAFARRKSR